jgi:glycosyltransferase involved in cell wall biosynthesis
MSTPLVSIITPTYNHASYIADCIVSAQSQSYSNWEMLVIDDGSTDNTFAIAQTFAAKDSRIKVFTQKNVGIFRLAESYNFALAQSNGKYIAVLEGDDVWLPEKLTLQIQGLEANDELVLSYGQAYSSTSDLSENYSLSDLSGFQSEVLTNNPIGKSTEVLLFRNFLVALTVVIRRTTLEEIGGFKQSHGLPLVDLTTWMELSLHGKFLPIHQALGKWRFYPHQITKTYTAEISQGFFEFTMAFFDRECEFFKSTTVNKVDLKKHFHRLLVEANSRSGRYKLMRKDFAGARKNYLKSIFFYGCKGMIWKFRSVVGFIFSLFHTDIETFAKRLGRVSYK